MSTGNTRARIAGAPRNDQTYSVNPSIVSKVPRCLRLLEKPSAEALEPEVFLEYQKDHGVCKACVVSRLQIRRKHQVSFTRSQHVEWVPKREQ